MPKFRVPIKVSVAPVQSYEKTIEVEASSREEAVKIIRESVRPGSGILDEAINSPGWKVIGGRMGPIQPDRTTYNTYLNEEDLDAWGAEG